MLRYKYIIWDWNGTLLDDVDINIEIINILLSERGLPLIDSTDKYRNLFSFPIQSFYKELGFTFKDEPFETVARQYAFMYDERYPFAEVSAEAESLLRTFRQEGAEQLIISATEQGFLTRQVTYFEIEQYFTDILGTSDIYVKSKVSVAQRWMQENGVSPDEILFVGDTVHDKEVADSIGCECILVAKGHQPKELLTFSGEKLFWLMSFSPSRVLL